MFYCFAEGLLHSAHTMKAFKVFRWQQPRKWKDLVGGGEAKRHRRNALCECVDRHRTLSLVPASPGALSVVTLSFSVLLSLATQLSSLFSTSLPRSSLHLSLVSLKKKAPPPGNRQPVSLGVYHKLKIALLPTNPLTVSSLGRHASCLQPWKEWDKGENPYFSLIFFSFCMHQFSPPSIFEDFLISSHSVNPTLPPREDNTKWAAAEYILCTWIIHERGLIYLIKCKWCVHFPGCLTVRQVKWSAPQLVHIVGARGILVIQEALCRSMKLECAKKMSHNLCHISFPLSFFLSLCSAYFQWAASVSEISLHANEQT